MLFCKVGSGQHQAIPEICMSKNFGPSFSLWSWRSAFSPQTNEAAVVLSAAKNGAIPRTKPGDCDNLIITSQPSQRSQPRDGLSEELQCPICLEMFNRATTLGCGHTFCADCLQQARDTSGDRCPLCRDNIVITLRSVTLDNIISGVMVGWSGMLTQGSKNSG